MDHSSDFHAPPPPPPGHHRGFFIPKTLIIVLVVFAVGWWGGTQGYFGGSNEKDEVLQTIKVTGTGVVEVTEAQADEISMSGSIETDTDVTGMSDDDIRLENSQAVEKVEQVLISLGIDTSDFQIYQGYSIPRPRTIVSPVPLAPKPTATPTPASIDASRGVEIQAAYVYNPNALRSSLTITLDKSTSKLADSISERLESLASSTEFPNTQISVRSKSYIIKEASRKKFENKASEEALKDAKTQIDNISKINNLKVGKTLSIKKIEQKDRPYYSPDIYFDKTESISSSYEVEYEMSNRGWFGL